MNEKWVVPPGYRGNEVSGTVFGGVMTINSGSAEPVVELKSVLPQPPRRKVIYIAGPYRDPRGEFYVRCNIREAERAALWVWLHGAVALCPHKNTAGLGGAHGITDRTWLDGDLELLRRCDAIYLIPGWESSQGAQAEAAFAREHDIPLLYGQADVLRFLE